jgi:hypothetical protein
MNEPKDHATFVKFTGSGYRAHCMTHGCRFIGQNHQVFKHLGYGQAGALRKAQMLAEYDASQHRDQERRRLRAAP